MTGQSLTPYCMSKLNKIAARWPDKAVAQFFGRNFFPDGSRYFNREQVEAAMKETIELLDAGDYDALQESAIQQMQSLLNAETIFFSVILLISIAPIITIGIVQYRSEELVVFWSGEKPPKREQITGYLCMVEDRVEHAASVCDQHAPCNRKER